MLAKFLNSKYFISLALFILALLPRLPDLGRFLTADEFLWADRSRNFLAGLTNPAYRCDTVVEKWEFAQGLACTLRTGHPGVTTMWTGSLGFWLRWLGDGRPGSLHDYTVAISTDPLDATFIAPERLGTVLITSLWVVAVYWLARRLFGGPVALLGAVLIALDPFHIALSRVIHHDALSTTFMTLSALAALIYWGENSQRPAAGHQPAAKQGLNIAGHRSPVAGRYLYARRWLILSGLLAGFGFLSKSPALFLCPFIALVGLWFTLADEKRKAKAGRSGASRTFILGPSSLILLIADGLLWFAAALVVVFAFWPAMWVIPLETIQTVIFIGSKYATGGHAKGNFFLGTISQDPGPLFYPVTWLYRTSPLVVLGVASALVAWIAGRVGGWKKGRLGDWEIGRMEEGEDGRVGGWKKGRMEEGGSARSATSQSAAQPAASLSASSPPHPPTPSPSHSPTLPLSHYFPLILLFILGFYLLMTIGEKKQDRYFLPVYPWLNLIAAAGLLTLTNRLTDYYTSLRFTFHVSRFTFHVSRFPLLILLILTVNGLLVALNFPYYLTYYNPLLGGIKGAEQAVTIGWGEGLDVAAAYLNQKHAAIQPRIASWYESTFTPFYDGPSISYSKEKGKALAGDYVIFYINQTQRRFPDDIFFDYFETRFKPEKVITLHGVDYAWIYPSLGVDHYIADQTYTGIASLLAWQWLQGDGPLSPGQLAEFELYWEYLGKQPDEAFFFRLLDAQGRSWAEGLSQPVAAENPPPAHWREGEIIVERGSLQLPPDIAPGQYRLQVGFYTKAPAVTEGELTFSLPPTEALLTVTPAKPAPAYTLPPAASPIEQPLGDSLTLLGASWPGKSSLVSVAADPPGATPSLPLDLYWRIERLLPADFYLHVGLMDTAGAAQQAWFNLSMAETLTPTQTIWPPGTVIHTRWQLILDPKVPGGDYHFDLVLPPELNEGQMESLSFGQVVLKGGEVSKE